jgi:hypothetical protein
LAPFVALLLSVLVLATGCGGGSASPETVVREWSDALNEGDNERAADLFADGAQIVQGSNVFFLQTHADAVDFNSSLPCSGRIVDVQTEEETATGKSCSGTSCRLQGRRPRRRSDERDACA